MVLRKQGETARSKEEMDAFQKLKAGEDEEVNAGNLNNEGNRLMAEGKTQEAAKAYTEAVRLDPTNARWHYNLSGAGQLGDQAGDGSAGKGDRTRIPTWRLPTINSAYLIWRLGRTAKRSTSSGWLCRLTRGLLRPRTIWEWLTASRGRGTEAAEMFRRATENDPKYAKAFVNLGLTLGKRGIFQASEQTLLQAVKLAPNDPSALTALGWWKGKWATTSNPFRRLGRWP